MLNYELGITEVPLSFRAELLTSGDVSNWKVQLRVLMLWLFTLPVLFDRTEVTLLIEICFV